MLAISLEIRKSIVHYLVRCIKLFGFLSYFQDFNQCFQEVQQVVELLILYIVSKQCKQGPILDRKTLAHCLFLYINKYQYLVLFFIDIDSCVYFTQCVFFLRFNTISELV